MIMKRLLTIILASLTALTISAANPVTSTYTIEAGGGSTLDTYLSPLKYTGPVLRVSGQWDKHPAWSVPSVSMQFNASLGAQFNKNPARTTREYLLELDFDWGLMKHWLPTPDLTLGLGGAAELYVGGAYLPRNSNNPADAKASLGLSLKGMAAYSFRIGRLPVTACEQVSLPSLSAFFSQQYGEPYYEIYLGNHSGLIHCGWWGNAFAINNLLSATLHFRHIDLLVGYRWRVRSWYVCHINTQIVSHSFVVGCTF